MSSLQPRPLNSSLTSLPCRTIQPCGTPRLTRAKSGGIRTELSRMAEMISSRASKKLRTEMDDDETDVMEVDGKVLEEDGDVRKETKAYLKNGNLKPQAPDAQAYLDNPFDYNPNSDCLNGTVDAENNTALICAVKAGSDRAFYALLEGKNQGYVNFQNSKGVTALNIASHRGYVDYVRELITTAKADVNIPNTSGSTSLIQASHFGHAEVVHLLLTHGATVDRPNHKGTTALMRAAQEGHLGVVDALLHCGADVNKRNHEKMNALMLASQRGHDGIVKLLIKHGADIDCQTVQGSTALMLACKRQHEAVVAVLLTAGAEMFITDSRQRTARDTAQKRNNKNIINMLQSSQQVHLMQMEARVQRSHLMTKLYELNSQKRAFPVADINPSPVDNSTQVLCRIFDMPFSLFQVIVRFMPWPRMWDAVLPMLHKRCNIDPNEAMRGALTVMDEVFTDLLVSKDPVQEMHLVRAAREPAIGELLRSKYKMPPDMFDAIARWNDVQSVLSRFERGVTFSNLIADRAVKDAARLYSWYRLGGDDELAPGEDGEEEDEHDGGGLVVPPPPFMIGLPGDLNPHPPAAVGGAAVGGGGMNLFHHHHHHHHHHGGGGGHAAHNDDGAHHGGDYQGFESGSSDGDLE